MVQAKISNLNGLLMKIQFTMRKIQFTKMVATGNDFIVMDNRSSSLVARRSFLAKKLCDRKTGIGADGLLLLEKSRKADFRMRILNPDGSEPDMCGNGSRCIALYAFLNKIAPKNMSIETAAGILTAGVDNNMVKINMTEPKDTKLNINVISGKRPYKIHYINTGVPHAICFVRDVDKIDVFKIGRGIRYHKAFMPKGANVDFVQVNYKSGIFMRTYERGVESETLACGTGAVASALISALLKGYSSPLMVYTNGGILNIYFKKGRNNNITDVFLEGEAKEVFTGEIGLAG